MLDGKMRFLQLIINARLQSAVKYIVMLPKEINFRYRA